MELAYHVSSGVRPEKPANAEAIGISNSLWKLLQRCWDGDKTQRPQIREVVARAGSAADNWHADMPPSVVDHLEDPSEEDSDELEHGGSSFSAVALFVLRPSVQLGHLKLIRARTRGPPAPAPILRAPATGVSFRPNPLRWRPTKGISSLYSST